MMPAAAAAAARVREELAAAAAAAATQARDTIAPISERNGRMDLLVQ